MHYLEDGQWRESEAVIEITPTGAATLKGNHQVRFLANLNAPGAVDLVMRDGKRLTSHILGLSYFDAATGQNVLIAELKDSIGVLTEPNVLIYPNAFTDLKADVRYTYTKAGLEQDVIFREQFSSPADYGLNPQTTRLQLLTEFNDPPAPHIQKQVRGERECDAILDFGAMQIGVGKAFFIGHETALEPVTVDKAWVKLNERNFLIEELDYQKIKNHLGTLPLPAHAAIKPTAKGVRHVVSLERLLPKRAATNTKKKNSIEVAILKPREKGFVLDYSVLSSATNFTFKGDTTYYMSGRVTLSQATVIEGGTVVKFSSNAPAISVTGSIDCKTEPYRPAVFTAKDDNTVGETISGSTGSPSGKYGEGLDFSTSGGALNYLRFSHANSAVTLLFNSGEFRLGNMQFIDCRYALNLENNGENTIYADNCLYYLVTNVINGGYDNIFRGQHLTVDACNKFWVHAGSANSELYLTNCLLVAITNGLGSLDVVSTNQVVTYASASGVFQTVGAGSHYLADSSTNRDTGTTNITSSLAADLKKKTTYPPFVYTNNFSVDTMLQPYAQRDTDTPDRGYHYDPLDYVVSGRTVAATVKLTCGVALGIYGSSSSYGLGLNSGGLISEGNPGRLNWIVRYNTVQEQSTTNWSFSSVASSVKMLSSSPTVRTYFTGWSLPGGTGNHFDDTTSSTGLSSFTHSQFYGGKFTGNEASFALTNCLWHRVYVSLEDNGYDKEWYLYNNLFYGGTLFYKAQADSPVLLAYDNLFDRTTITRGGTGEYFTHDYNGYITNQTRLSPNASNDVILADNPAYETGLLGRFYYPDSDGNLSLLLDAGSRTTEDARLSNFTVLTNQTLDSSAVDIGFHYRERLWVSTNATPTELAQLLMPPGVIVTNATNIGAQVALGLFTNGFAVGLPIEGGVILSSGDIALAIGPNNQSDAGLNNNAVNDTDLDSLVGTGIVANAAVLEFDIISSNSFLLQFKYIFASEEYPEYINTTNGYSDPMAIFVSTNYNGTNWVINTTNNIALVPGTSTAVTVNSINGGGTNISNVYVPPANPQYYVDNGDPNYSTKTPIFNLQYDGTTVLLTAQIQVSANVTNHIKIAIEDFGDAILDSALFLKAWSSCE